MRTATRAVSAPGSARRRARRWSSSRRASSAYGVTRGWFDSGSVEGTTVGLRARARRRAGQSAPARGPSTASTPRRTRANPALDLRPALPAALVASTPARCWSSRRCIAGGRAIVGTNCRPRPRARRRHRAACCGGPTCAAGWRRRPPSPATCVPVHHQARRRAGPGRGAPAREVWRRRVGSAVESSPLVVGGSAYIGTLVRAGDALARAHRRRALERPGRRRRSRRAWRSPGRNVVVGDYSGHVDGVPPVATDGRSGSARARASGCGARGASTPGRRWRTAASTSATSTAGSLALDADTGEVAWVRVLDDFVYSSAAVADRTGLRGQLRPPPLRPRRRHRARCAGAFDAGERISGSPSVVGRPGLRLDPGATPVRRAARSASTPAPAGALLTFPDGRYSPAVGDRGLLVLTGVRTLYGLTPRG